MSCGNESFSVCLLSLKMEAVLSDISDTTISANWGSPNLSLLPLYITQENDKEREAFICVDAAALGDIPARYTISCVQDHECPIIGVYVDPRIVPGYKYKVRILPDINEESHYPVEKHEISSKNPCFLFGERSLTLLSIGRGYSRRFMFEPNQGYLNENTNYFWSDSHPGGFALQISVLSEGDHFTVMDCDHNTSGLVEVYAIQGPQKEVSQTISIEGVVKNVKVTFNCRAEQTYRDRPTETSFTTISGVVECIKKKGFRHALVTKIHSLTISGESASGITLLPVK